MGFLQRWLDEPDQDVARYAKAFYVLTFLFMAVFVAQLVQLALRRDGDVGWADVVGPLVSLLLTSTMHSLALDGRRSHKAMKAARESAALPGPKP